MNVRMVVLAVLVAASLALVPAHAQPVAGQSNISLAASFSTSAIADVDMNLFTASLGYGKFTSDTLELGASFDYAKTDIESLDATSWMLLGKAKFHARARPGQQTVPYAGLQAGWVGSKAEIDGLSESDTSFAWGAMLGAKTYVAENHFWFYELNYLKYDVADVDVKTTSVVIGQAFVF